MFFVIEESLLSDEAFLFNLIQNEFIFCNYWYYFIIVFNIQ